MVPIEFRGIRINSNKKHKSGKVDSKFGSFLTRQCAVGRARARILTPKLRVCKQYSGPMASGRLGGPFICIFVVLKELT